MAAVLWVAQDTFGRPLRDDQTLQGYPAVDPLFLNRAVNCATARGCAGAQFATGLVVQPAGQCFSPAFKKNGEGFHERFNDSSGISKVRLPASQIDPVSELECDHSARLRFHRRVERAAAGGSPGAPASCTIGTYFSKTAKFLKSINHLLSALSVCPEVVSWGSLVGF